MTEKAVICGDKVLLFEEKDEEFLKTRLFNTHIIRDVGYLNYEILSHNRQPYTVTTLNDKVVMVQKDDRIMVLEYFTENQPSVKWEDGPNCKNAMYYVMALSFHDAITQVEELIEKAKGDEEAVEKYKE